MPSFAITPLTEHTGAVVSGLDFAQPVDPETRDVLNRAFVDHHVLVMRDQHFAPDQFKTAAQSLLHREDTVPALAHAGIPDD